MQESLLSVLKALVGELRQIFPVIIGAICAVLGGFIAKHLGKLHCAVENWKIKYLKEGQNSTGGLSSKEVVNIKECTICRYFMDIYLFNSTEIPKALRDLYIEFKGKGFSISNKPSDSKSRTYKYGSTQIQPLKYVNLEPKKMVHLTLEGSLDSGEAKRVYLGATVYLRALDHKARTFRRKLTKTVVPNFTQVLPIIFSMI